MNLTTLTCEDLDILRTDAAIEQERRQTPATISGHVREFTVKYVDGGDSDDLHRSTWLPG